MRTSRRSLFAGLTLMLALAAPLAAQGNADSEPGPASHRLAIADQPAATVLKKAEANAAADAAIRDAQKMSKEFRPAAAIKRLDDELATAQGQQRGKIVAAKGYVQIAAKDHAGAEASFAKIARGEEPASEADYADARRRVAYLKLKRGDEDAALQEFLAIGTGLVKASPNVTADAARRAAAILHKTGKYEQALDMYTQLAVQAPTLDAKLDAHLQLAGILLEIGKGDYGKIDDVAVRNHWYQLSMDACREIADTPGVAPETQAIAELMYLEGYYFQKDFAKARDLSIDYVKKWGKHLKDNPARSKKDWNAARQVVTAETWLCFCYYRLGQYEECIATAQAIRSGKWKESDPYPVFNSFAYSMVYEAFANEKLGRADAGAKLREDVKAAYPQWASYEIERTERRVGLREATQ